MWYYSIKWPSSSRKLFKLFGRLLNLDKKHVYTSFVYKVCLYEYPTQNNTIQYRSGCIYMKKHPFRRYICFIFWGIPSTVSLNLASHDTRRERIIYRIKICIFIRIWIRIGDAVTHFIHKCLERFLAAPYAYRNNIFHR